jgi:hypothetical protein
LFKYEWKYGIYIHHKTGSIEFNIIELITSKEYIEAICRYIIENKLNKWESITTWYKANTYSFINPFIDTFTAEQAIAIRDCKLEEFIKTILDIK